MDEAVNEIIGSTSLPDGREFPEPRLVTVMAHDKHDYVVAFAGHTGAGVAIIHAVGCRACAAK